MNIENKNANFTFFADKKEKISVFIGAYGSGKSEIAVNTAIFLSENPGNNTIYKDIAIADLDIINPFFRSADARVLLKEKNIHLISSVFANTNAEVPAVPAEVYSVFDKENVRGIFDIGGEDAGSKIVASLKSRLVQVPHTIYFVVNINRPFTDTEDKIIVMMKQLEDSCKLKIDYIINNTNLLEYSDIKDLNNSNRMLKNVSERTGISLAFCCAMEDIVPAEWKNRTPDGENIMLLKRSIVYYGEKGFL